MPLANEDDGKAELGEDGAVHGMGMALLVVVRHGEEGNMVELAWPWFLRIRRQRWASWWCATD